MKRVLTTILFLLLNIYCKESITIHGNISGQVVPLVGVNICNTESGRGIFMDDNGYYALKLPSADTLSIIFSYMGYHDSVVTVMTDKIEISESDLALLNSYALEKSSDGEQRNAVVDEVLLKYFAMAVAKSLKHPEICQTLKKKIGEKFDGDYDALWDHIKNKRISGRDLRVLVNSRFSERTRNVLPIEKIEEIPLLQVALPVNFDNWDGESTILVAYTPLTIDDMEWKEIYAYDADLKEYILDAKTEPDYPVMVVGINERTEVKNQDNKKALTKSNALTPFKFTLPHPGVAHNEVVVQDIQIEDDCEPWYKGDAEVIAKQNLYDGWTTTVDMGSYDEGTYYGKNILIAWEGSNPVSNPYVKIYEDDYSSDDLMLNVATASITDAGWLNGPNAKITLKVGYNVLWDFSSFWFSIGN